MPHTLGARVLPSYMDALATTGHDYKVHLLLENYYLELLNVQVLPVYVSAADNTPYLLGILLSVKYFCSSSRFFFSLIV